MLHREYEPPEELRDAIKCFWYTMKDFGSLQADFEVVPDGYAEIIFHFGNGCSMANSDGLQPLPSPFIVGLLGQPAVFNTRGRFETIAIRCYPWTVFDLLGLQPDKGVVRLLAHPIAGLQPTLSGLIETGKIEEAVAVVQQYLLAARQPVVTDDTLAKAGAAMTEANGTMPVGLVATAAHATVRTLERKFKQSSGHSVKDVSGLMRFEQVRNHLWTYPDANIAALAQELGYTDQSHLSREFKRYSSTTPGAFARKAKERR